MIQFRANYSRRIFVHLIISFGLLFFALAANTDYIIDIYFKNQITRTGYLVNGGILILFFLGLSKLIMLLFRYMREESSLARFIENVEAEQAKPVEGVSPKSIIFNRYKTIVAISMQNVAVNHGALASTTVATESTRISLPKFISNILILTGVFGTIVSLSIALLGASNILGAAEGINGMGVVIHGMSTALSTTTTAIVCYIFYGYFYLKLADVQTQLISGVEQVTSVYILPKYTYQTDSMLHEVGQLVKELRLAAEAMKATQDNFAAAGANLRDMTESSNEQLSSISSAMAEVRQLLREGFRLP
ncbi:MAG: hypothetical protein OQL06_05735 [Gammaproteobacteria bacterium]|nr:hypothetical protein [Gammaproteobacteria bacterium]